MNRMPTPLLSNSTPFEKLFGKSPDYFELKCFGCLCFVNTLERNRTKLDYRAQKAVFFGYVSRMKGYRLYVPDTHKFIISRNVKFIEHIFPFNRECDINETVGIRSSNETCTIEVNKQRRKHKQPECLKDYHCNLIQNQDTTPLEKDKLYPLSSVLSYINLSHEHKAFSLAISAEQEPKNYQTASKQKEWIHAMETELKALEDNQTWSIVPLPEGKIPIGCKWVYKVKRKSDGSIERYKARIVAKGYTQ